MNILLMPILPTVAYETLPMVTYEKITEPNLAYIVSKEPNMTNIVGGNLTDLWTYIGLCSLHRFFCFS